MIKNNVSNKRMSRLNIFFFKNIFLLALFLGLIGQDVHVQPHVSTLLYIILKDSQTLNFKILTLSIP